MPLHPGVTAGGENLPDAPRETCGGWGLDLSFPPVLRLRDNAGTAGARDGEGDVLLEGDFGVPFDFGQ